MQIYLGANEEYILVFIFIWNTSVGDIVLIWYIDGLLQYCCVSIADVLWIPLSLC